MTNSERVDPLPITAPALTATPVEARTPDAVLSPTEQVLCRALLGLRWAGLALAVLAVTYDRDRLQRPATAWWGLAAMVIVTVTVTLLFRRRASLLLHPTVIVVEAVVAVGVQIGDGWAFGPWHAFDVKALGAVWVLAPVMTAGIAWGPVVGGAAGMVVAASRLIGGYAPNLDDRQNFFAGVFADDSQPRFLPVATSITLFTLAGLGTGYVTRLLKRAENQIAELRARQAVASVLHDGALQAFAYIARRSADPDIARVARDADTELRGYLAATPTPHSADLRGALITAARRIERLLDGQLRVAVDEELPDRPAQVVAALTGAVTEALTNAARHAQAGHVTLYAAAGTAGIDVTVVDDGDGFDPAAVAPGGGLDQSIRARLRIIGGTATIHTAPGEGTEVQLWAP